MNPDRFQKVAGIFAEACKKNPEERGSYLAEVCASDVGLRNEVELLLEQDEQPTDFIDRPILGGDFELRPPDYLLAHGIERLPETIGGYSVLRKLGEGGMGVVYLAEQQMLRRTVALKVIKPDIVSPPILRRFEHEAQLLGRLRHEGIAQIFESGVAASSEPGHRPRAFFAMEFIHGRPLLEYAQENGINTRQRLELMVKVCKAVEHAHQKGVIHRDLKPHNILVEENGQPKILDFGVARATDSDVQLTTLHTAVGQLVGTLPYMSPEQITGNPNEVDTRTDVYALGVNLYQLLSGRLPYNVDSRSIADAARVIRDEEPERLSAVSKVYRGDIETIVAKALEKDKNRRYQSAADLAADIEHYLNGEPIAVKRDSNWYVVRKTLRRYKVAMFVGAAFLLLAMAASISLLFLYRNAESQSALAKRESQRAAEAEVKARSDAQTARVEALKAKQISEFLESMLRAADPRKAKGEDLSMREVLDEAERKIETEAIDNPEVEAAIHATLGSVYSNLGLYDKAEPHFQKALDLRRANLGPNHPDTARSMQDLGVHYSELAKYQDAERLLRDSLAILRGTVGDDHVDVPWAMKNLGLILDAQGKSDEAERMLRGALASWRRIVAVPDADPELERDIADSLQALALLLFNRSQVADAEALSREALDVMLKHVSADDPTLAVYYNNLGAMSKAQNRFEETETYYREALRLVRKGWGDEHPDVAAALGNLSTLLADMGKYAEAEPLYRESLAIRRKSLPEGHPVIANALAGLGFILMRNGRFDEAAPLLSEAVEIRKNSLPPGSWQTANAMSLLGECLAAMAQYGEAEPMLLDGLAGLQAAKGDNDRATQMAVLRVVDFYEAIKNPTKAAEYRARLKRDE